MKRFKTLTLSLLIVSALLMPSCKQKGDEATPTPTPTPTAPADTAASPAIPGDLKIEDYYPVIPNRLMAYEGEKTFYKTTDDGIEEIPYGFIYLTFPDYIHGERNQKRTMSFINGSEASMGEVYEIKNGMLTLIRHESSFYDHTDLTAMSKMEEVLILQEPFVIGNKWIRYQDDSYIETAEIISLDTEVTVPYGTFTAMVVEVVDASRDETSKEYYVQGLGCVKIENESPSYYQYQHLVAVSDEPLAAAIDMVTDWVVAVDIDEEGEEYYYMDVKTEQWEIQYTTNCDVLEIYNQAAREYIKAQYGHELDAGVKINSAVLDRNQGLLIVDMSAAFPAEMMKAGDDEGRYLQLFADTIGWLYNAYHVTFSVDGGAYATENITIDPAAGDYIVLSLYKDAKEMMQ